ncbi:CAP domain-containing protein [Pedobacter sp. MC2016-24]|uniref:CAP domain-containing protein n=1 Tax=Pedobacter sp. MC2016-24 TaxID=2780090 RepID=UPI0018805B69|nr:CAP domain-containing protein [Pedobacter sp. MC2016-24]MBE9602092.1 CAP domain-containing protein [Pedobacter sp. MC2016-24]
MKLAYLLLLLFIPLLQPNTVAAQQSRYSFTKEELKMANTAGNAGYLTGQEKDMVMYINLARMDGEKFFYTYFEQFIDDYNQDMRQYNNYNELKVNRNTSYYRSLKKTLSEVKNLPVFWPDEALTQIARNHATDLNRNNFAGHQSSNGRSVKDRIDTVYPNKSSAENLAFGFPTGLGNVCMLLLDKGVPDLGHRKSLLNTNLKLNRIGACIGPHPAYRYCAVIDLVSLPN